MDALDGRRQGSASGCRTETRRSTRTETGTAGSPLSASRTEIPRVAIVDDNELASSGKLAAALDRAGFWEILARAKADRASSSLSIVIKPELAGFIVASPSITDPALVEALIDLLHDRDFTNVAVVGTADSSALWAENRDLYALSDLLGYRFITPRGRSYDIIDLADTPDESAFSTGSILHGSGISRTWIDADLRVVFAKNRTDEATGYALCLDTLIGVLPLIDKDLHYRRRRHPGDVVTALLAAAPVQFCLIDAIVSSHGAGGRRAPEPIDTATLIAASDIVLGDYIGALKMGLDPATSPVFARTVRTHPLPARYSVSGALAPYAGWMNVPDMLLRTTQMRSDAEALGRLVEPWLQRLDPELFPLKHPLDARLNAALAEFFADAGSNTVSQWLLIVANALLGLVGQTIESYRTLFDKDALRQHSVPLGIDTDAVPDDAFDDLVAELLRLEPIAASAPQMSEGLCWRYVEDAVVFCYARTLPIDHDLFVQRVDIARTIQFMNDYLGGVVVPLAHDRAGRPVRQAERNIYLPQPNYLVLYQGKPIDVSKLEVVEYGVDRHRLYWKTIGSENGSATFDDGIATFERTEEGTRITIVGRQLFTLPLFWQVFDLKLVPDIKSGLVTHAYRTFFDRTIANFEALVEGREIRIGRPVDEPAPPAVEQLMPLLQGIGDLVTPLVQRMTQAPEPNVIGGSGQVDADGFTHVVPAASPQPNTGMTVPEPDRWIAEIARFIDGFRRAVQRDLTRSGRPK
jgi:uncharacterized protein (DUF362 family)